MKHLKKIEIYNEEVELTEKNLLFESPTKDMHQIEDWENHLRVQKRPYVLVQVETKKAIKGYVIYTKPLLKSGINYN